MKESEKRGRQEKMAMSEKQKLDEQKHLKSPLIIAMKGHSCSSKSAIARQLADCLKCPLIDDDDITLALRTSLPTSSNNSIVSSPQISYLPFETVCQIASTQLSFKMNVIINTPLDRPTNLDRLLQLASTNGALLIIIDCKTQDDDDDDNDVGDVPKLVVDTTKPFVAENFVSAMLQLADEILKGSLFPKASPRNQQMTPEEVAEFHLKADDILEQNLSLEISLRNQQTDTKEFQRHLHALNFSKQPRKGNRLKCISCRKLIAGPTYQCIECDQFVLHKSCAESPSDIELLKQNCPPYLRQMPPKYDFPTTRRCIICESFSNCYDCLLQTNLECGLLPSILKHEGHVHPLNLVIMPLTYNYEYRCACGDFGRFISYKCYDCNFDLHINCTLLPRTVENPCHGHPLTLTYKISKVKDEEHYQCNICKQIGKTEEWAYYCQQCHFIIHVSCVTSDE